MSLAKRTWSIMNIRVKSRFADANDYFSAQVVGSVLRL